MNKATINILSISTKNSNSFIYFIERLLNILLLVSYCKNMYHTRSFL